MNSEFTFQPASAQELGLYSSVYKLGRVNVWFPTSIARYQQMLTQFGEARWLLHNGIKAGIFLVAEDKFGFLSLIPPFNDEWAALRAIVTFLKQPGKRLTALSVDEGSYRHYRRLGFQFGTGEKCMIRPTEEFQVTWPAGFVAERPVRENINEMADLALASFRQSTLPVLRESTWEYFHGNFTDLFADQTPELMQKASTILKDSQSGSIVGLCTMEFWEELPCIAQLAVSPKYQGQGLAKKLVQQALSDLRPYYPLVRLWVQVGNSAETLYHHMGFLAGAETCTMTLD